MFNPLQSTACLKTPLWVTDTSAWVHHLPAAFALIEAVAPRVLVELGTHRGDSYCAFCQTVEELGLATRCHAVDTWQGDPQSGVYGNEVLDELRRHHDPRYGEFSRLMQMDFDTARLEFAPGSVDLLHIDGFHSYEAARHDFETWLPTLSSRGVVMLHDVRVRQPGFGVWRLWEELGRRYEHFEFAHVHGLGVLLVGPEQSEAVRGLAEAARHSPGFHELFDALGHRSGLLQSELQHRSGFTLLHGQIAAEQAELVQQQSVLARQEADLTAYREASQRQHQVMDHQQTLIEGHRAHIADLESRNQQLAQQMAYYGQLRFRLVERLNEMLQWAGPVHGWTKRLLMGGLQLARKARSSQATAIAAPPTRQAA